MQIAPMNPWLHMYYATTGNNALSEVINGDPDDQPAGDPVAVHEAERLVHR